MNGLTIKTFYEGLKNKKFKAVEIVEEYYKRIAEKDEEIGTYLSLNKTDAISQAKKLDSDIENGKEISILAGTPLAIKDNILIKNQSVTAASKILSHYRGAYDATVIKKLKEKEAIFLGKTNLDEFAMGSSTENSAFKITKNPFDSERVPGGSSGGSAAAVAADLCVAALGSDTGGSIRQPASFCGVVGLKPTYGAVSRYGLIAMASSLDQIGPITKTVEDAEILFDAIKGKDSMDSTSIDLKLQTTNHKLQTPKVIGIPKEYFEAGGLDKEVAKALEEAIKNLKNLGFKFKEISLPYTKYAVACYYIIMPAEASTNLARYDGLRYGKLQITNHSPSQISGGNLGGQESQTLKEIYFDQRGGGFGQEVKKRIILGSFVLSAGYYDAYYLKAQKVRRLIREGFNEAFKEVDVILAPASPTPAFKIGEKITDPLSMYLSDIFTIPANLAGLPAISIPVNLKPNLPVGFQLIGKPFCEDEILTIGKKYENCLH
ncbi:Asp-tRNA(Asn)/Glu-tRNA(Gln) amidotransferase GatCAB subunit A [Candidatus Wolfebacteria bacterium CG03_land_8_20_14_0_80_36_15]|uniref:Glutamyl-tRNA(Gln) amidotransferase subunit A n=1 Tax=Candidatus Wolfebacteria bacterium CG03_land_8_20_14_0_80_36_15 TaxID=1975067 RepID=A0A2M7B8H8_9BACT|nr:MAG: Asp-tRNA(Asn)/Glu-tRNA(Gln) amidotransferase GatCAB subunit A [Candidatus Wolfebacteria bacterium CG03_land_8_20_14_0_80_36_15]